VHASVAANCAKERPYIIRRESIKHFDTKMKHNTCRLVASYHCLSTKNKEYSQAYTNLGGGVASDHAFGSQPGTCVEQYDNTWTVENIYLCIPDWGLPLSRVQYQWCTLAAVEATPQHSECNAGSDTFGIIHKTVRSKLVGPSHHSHVLISVGVWHGICMYTSFFQEP